MRMPSIVLLAAGLVVAAVPAQDPPPAQPDKLLHVPMELKTRTGTLSGTLDLPAGKGPFPVTLLIAGSGPTDRNGNQPPFLVNDSLKKLGEALAQRGIAVLRYDRRGVGASRLAQPGERDLRFDMLVEDAADWVKLLRADKRFTRVGVMGHSEGALVGLLATRRAQADAYVSLAGAGRRIPDILRQQLKKLRPDLRDKSDKILDELAAGRTVADPPRELASLFRPSVQPYLISWFRYDPAREIAAVNVPVLIVQGTTDLQIAVEDARALAAAKKDARLVLVDGMNHVLRLARTQEEQNKSYFSTSQPLAPRLADEVAHFLHKSLAGRGGATR